MNQSQSMAGLASLVQSRGRNGDSMLVHMTPGEVHGLQRLALAHGGSLTVNPDTGLVEANFLKKLLPTLLGVGLNFLVPGLGALGSGLLVGGVEAARTGDIGKGLMAGLGAYGGAGLGSSLAGIGAASKDAATKLLTEEAAKRAGKDTAAKIMEETAANQVKQQMANQALPAGATFGQRLSNLGSGLGNIGTGIKEVVTGGQGLGLSGFGGAKTLASVMPGGVGGLAATGMGVANAMTPDYKMPTGGDMDIDQSYYEGGDYDPITGTFRQGQWRKGYPGFPGGMAGGGVIPAPNGNYPLAKPSNSVGAYESDIDTYTGEERFADGGGVGGSQSLEQYYQSLLAPPTQQPASNPAFASYLQGLNQYITSPVEAPKPAAPPKAQPPAGGMPPGGSVPGGVRPSVKFGGRFGGTAPGEPNGVDYGDYSNYGDGAMRWDANQGRFVSSGPQNPFSSGNMPTGNPFAGFGGINFSALQDYFRNAGAGSGGMPGSQNQYGGDVADTPLVDQGDMNVAPPDQGFGTAQPDQSGAGMPDFSGMDFSGLQNLNLSGMGGAGSYMPDMSAYAGQDQQQAPMGDMSAPPSMGGYDDMMYAGGSPNFNESGGGYQALQENFYQNQPDMSGQMGQSSFLDYSPEPPYTPPTYRAQEPVYQQPVSDYTPPALTSSPYDFYENYDYAHWRPPANLERPTELYEQPYTPIPDFGQGPDMTYGQAMMANNPAPDMSGLAGLASLGGREYIPPAEFSSGPIAPMQEPAPQPAPQPAFDYGAMMAQQPAPQPAPQPAFDMSSFGGFGGYQPQQPAAQPAPQPAFDYGAMMAQQPAPSFDMGSFGGGGMDFGGDMNFADAGAFAGGGSVEYAAAGKLLRGPGDGMSDSIKANISGRQEARLADGEFVIPADVVSHLGNGSTEAGSRKLYKMMADVRKARTGKRKQAPAIKAGKYVPS